MRVSIYQPDIPQNLAAFLRISACLKIPLDIIEPCGFPFSEKKFKRTVMDYSKYAEFNTFVDFESYKENVEVNDVTSRVILLTTNSNTNFFDFKFRSSDRLLLGRESEGVPSEVRGWVDNDIRVDMPGQGRSLNVVISCAMVLSEAIRQTRHL